MRDALAVMKLVWWSFRYGPGWWDPSRVFKLLRCAWKIYTTRRRVAGIMREISAYSSTPRFF